MKYFKISIFSLAVFSSFSYVHSTENENSRLWSELRETLASKPKRAHAENTDKPDNDKRRSQIDAGFLEIEKKIEFLLPDSFKEFHKNVEDLVFAPIFFPTPVGGTESPLYNLIMKGRRKNLPNEWVFIGEIDANEYIALNSNTQEITRFTVIPKVEMGNIFPTITTWLRGVYLNH